MAGASHHLLRLFLGGAAPFRRSRGHHIAHHHARDRAYPQQAVHHLQVQLLCWSAEVPPSRGCLPPTGAASALERSEGWCVARPADTAPVPCDASALAKDLGEKAANKFRTIALLQNLHRVHLVLRQSLSADGQIMADKLDESPKTNEEVLTDYLSQM